ncbi:MAG: hypothetical protein M3R36_15980 [Bacteroidota bacterium]|nr:hypothetical protein [Bacteroidota bacterium]
MKKKYKVLLLVLALTLTMIAANVFISRTAYAQEIPQEAINEYNLDNNSSFFEIRDAMNEYWESKNVQGGFVLENGEKKKVPGWKIYKRWEYYWEQRVNQVTGEFPKTSSITEYEKYLKNRKAEDGEKDNAVAWTSLGSSTSAGGYAGIGRINCITFHPTDVNTFWVGAAAGGIWKTVNGGTTWTILNNSQMVLGVSDIAVDYSNTNILYIATGDRDGGSLFTLSGGQSADNASIGVLKSINGGATWTTTGLTYTTSQGKKLYSLLIHPTNPQILFASTSDGIYKTINGGTTWVQKANNLFRCWRLAFKPGNPAVMYGSEDFIGTQYFASSVNSGETWTDFQFGSGADASRTELAVTAADPNVVYLLTANAAGGLNGVYKSVNSGVSFTKVNLGSLSMLYYNSDGSGPNIGQGTYDLCIAVSPTNANTVFIGGVNSWKSVNGGANWTCINHWSVSPPSIVHADKHALAFQNGTTLFEGNDGGIYKTANGGTTYTDLSNGLVISQLYRIGVSQTNSTTVLTGLQDNGSKLFNTGVWSDVKGGDGMECIVDYSTTTFMYATLQRGQISRSINNGASFPTDISANIPGGQPVGAWVAPYVISPVNTSTLFAGYDKVWKTVNRGDSWTSASQVLSAGNKLRAIAIAPSNANVLYAASGTSMWKTIDGGITNWTAVTVPAFTNSITYIAVKNTDPNTLWITYGGYTAGEKVYKSINGGASWTNISTGLPNLPIMSVVYDKSILTAENLYVGTDVGVYFKDGVVNWAAFNTGLPNVVVSELEIHYGAVNKLRAGTFGRGLWETNLGSAPPPSALCEDFSGVTYPPTNWNIEFTGTNYWSRSTVSSYGVGTGSSKFNYFDAAVGTTQSLVTLTFQNSVAGDSLKLVNAYAPFNDGSTDTLEILTSLNGGTTYSTLIRLWGNNVNGNLNTAAAIGTAFTPTAGQWATKKYSLPVGTNKVKFRARSGFGNNLYLDSICKVNTGAPTILLCEGFTGATFAPTSWNIEFAGTNYWTRNAVSSYGVGSGSAKFDYFSAPIATTQSLVTLTFTNSVAGDLLKFDNAYAPYTDGSTDSLEILTSVNGGTNYSTLAKLWGNNVNGNLNTAAPIGTSFTPTAGQWATKSYALPVGTNKIKFRARSGFGNNLYLDTICKVSSSSPVAATITLVQEGYYNTTTNKLSTRDTARFYLRNISSPYAIVDSAKAVIDSNTLATSVTFANALTGTYYLVAKSRNTIETWSKAGGEPYTRGAAFSYNYTTAANKAFGNNMIQVDASPSVRFAVYSGDVNQDRTIDLADVSLIDNDSYNFVSGYVKTDLTGDKVIDIADLAIADNNAFNFVSAVLPASPVTSSIRSNNDTQYNNYNKKQNDINKNSNDRKKEVK